MKILLCIIIILAIFVVQAEPAEVLFRQATINGKLANEGFRRCDRFVEGWLKQADSETGLIPRNLTSGKDIWNAQDAAADNYPFMVLTSAICNPDRFHGHMLDMLHTEIKLTSRIDALPDTYSFSRKGFTSGSPNLDSILFGSSEYIKDGLLPLTEWLGPSPWSERMISILDDMWKHAPVDTPFGRIVSTNVEVNGEMLQVLSRIYWMTGDPKYLDWAIRLGDYYLLTDNHPTYTGRDSGQWIQLDLAGLTSIAHVDIAWIYGDRRKYRFDISVSKDGKAWKTVYKGASSGTTNELEKVAFPVFQANHLRITGYGNNENDWTNIADLVVYDTDTEKVKIVKISASGFQQPNTPENSIDENPNTRWSVGGSARGNRLRLRDHGCEIVSGLCELYAAVHFARPQKKQQYRKPIHDMLDHILEIGRNEHGMFYNWIDPATGQHDSDIADTWGYTYNGYYTVYLIDGTSAYRDATRKALREISNYYNYAWEGSGSDGHADSIESALNLYNREPMPETAKWIDADMQVMWAIQKEDGVIEGWHGDGNFARTTIMYCLWKTQGITVQPWREDVIFGAVQSDDELYITLSAQKAWKGKLLFDVLRHKKIMHMPIDWPRINQFPEWFTVDDLQKYKIQEISGPHKIASGEELTNGLDVQVKSGKKRYFKVSILP